MVTEDQTRPGSRPNGGSGECIPNPQIVWSSMVIPRRYSLDVQEMQVLGSGLTARVAQI